jgi:hypothetical protein
VTTGPLGEGEQAAAASADSELLAACQRLQRSSGLSVEAVLEHARAAPGCPPTA